MLPYLDKKFFADVIKGLEVTRSFCVTQVSPKCYHKCPQKTEAEGRLPWWCSGWESACQRRGHGFDPWSGKIPHPAGQLSLCTATTEAALSQSQSHWAKSRVDSHPPPPRGSMGEYTHTPTSSFCWLCQFLACGHVTTVHPPSSHHLLLHESNSPLPLFLNKIVF